jgi:molybdate transport system substrate-binding protein
MSDETLVENKAGKGVVHVLSASAQRAALTACANAFVTSPGGASSGHSIQFYWATSGAVTQRLEDGERYDIVAASQSALQEMAAKRAIGQQIFAAGVSRIALGMRKGETPPDISSPAAFRQALLDARSFSRGDPAGGGTAGNFLAEMIASIDVLEQTSDKAILRVGGYNVMKEVAEGRADFGLTQSTEIVAVDGVEISAWLPDELQMNTVYAIAPGADSISADAQAFLDFVTGDPGAKIYAEAGFAPA